MSSLKMPALEPERKTLRVGIASLEEIKARTMAIARGELKPLPDDPSVWFPSAESFGKVLSGSNQRLLREILATRPASLTALAETTGREVSNLSRTLRTMERYGLVRLNKGPNGTIRPDVLYDKVEVNLHLAPT